MKYVRMSIEKESPEQLGYERIKNNLTETSVRDRNIKDLGLVLDDILLPMETILEILVFVTLLHNSLELMTQMTF